MCRLWPSISPWNVWQLPFGVWVGFARETDAYLAELRKQAREAGR